MDERIVPVAAPDYSDRRNVYFLIAKTISLLGHRFLVRPHVEMDGNILTLRQRAGTVFLYCGLHKSLWETTGVLPPLYLAGLPLPYVGMGDNLVRGRLFQAISKKIGTFLVRRPSNRRETLESARKLREDVVSFLAYGLDVMIFPEGTRKNIPLHARYGEFFPAAFDAALDYERNREAIVAGTPALSPRDLYIVPFNVDYTRVREVSEMIGQRGGRPQTLRVFDSFSMIRNIGDTYLSYGKPIRVADHIDMNRKQLAAFCRERCLDLVKILPVNVASRAMLELEPGAAVSPNALAEAIRRVLDRLRPYADRFRGFSLSDGEGEIISRAQQVQLDFRRFVPETVALYRLYASYIGHYLQRAPALAC
jgi:1-acyl-sn-glycerol-3-phosphate acyltransferase